ncbi:translation initiation factor eIF-2B subunit delta-like [Anneissia japonica]|uniref:translation initiation factor eIF-2B subunit delta-like n=1 Tax=Anneissia japonica TaxID=1529436 RepID=UPI001425606D|nr:translation initiation factor eIF-2B subunit delta-like [Anneissia japonica]XP_033104221.1 translation initiation factor eIF-2B subunit delta-like [Anneissia japonica]
MADHVVDQPQTKENLSSEKKKKKSSKKERKPKDKQSVPPAKVMPPAEGESDVPQKSKAELKAERRAKQEAQRAAKAGKKVGEVPTKPPPEGVSLKAPPRVSADHQMDDPKMLKKRNKRFEKQKIPQRKEQQKKVSLFSHLDQYERQMPLTKALGFGSCEIHPAIIKLGLQYAKGIICGSNARCIALMNTFKKVIHDYSTPEDKELSRDLESRIKPYISFLNQCRPKSVSMGNAIKNLKMQITHIPSDMPDANAKEELYTFIDKYLNEKIFLAAEVIRNYAITKIRDGDVIMVYGCSSLLCKVLCDAYNSGKNFRVVVVDSRPKMEGREGVRRLVKHGIRCSYILINALSYMMPEVSKVFLGAHALLANGYVMSRVGSSHIAMVAKSYNVPVLVCCETYKFCERAQTDSFVANELGDPDDLTHAEKPKMYLNDWRNIDSLTLLNLIYDVTPPDFVDIVITEIGMVPCTSVPVVLRMKSAV